MMTAQGRVWIEARRDCGRQVSRLYHKHDEQMNIQNARLGDARYKIIRQQSRIERVFPI